MFFVRKITIPKIHRIMTAETKVFMRGSIAIFPRNGKIFPDFSTLWKILIPDRFLAAAGKENPRTPPGVRGGAATR